MAIYSGQLYSYRHNSYYAAGKAKKNLIDQDLMYLLSEDKKDNLYGALSKSFKSLKSCGYTFKVLLPEAILYLFAKVEGISRIKAEVLLSSYSLQRTTELLNELSDNENVFLETSIPFKKREVIEGGNTHHQAQNVVIQNEETMELLNVYVYFSDKSMCKV
ncbi:uncharacterized protein LOC136088862 isoform X1 [Hydra vulgaris]